MFDIGFWEMAFIGVIALVVIGPERLPGAARTVGLWVGKGRRMLAEVQADVKKELDAQDLAQVRELKNELTSATQELSDIASVDSDPLGIQEAGEDLKQSMDELKAATRGEGTQPPAKNPSVSAKKTAKKKTTKKKTTKKKVAKKKAATKKTTKKKVSAGKTASKKASAKKAPEKKATSSARKTTKSKSARKKSPGNPSVTKTARKLKPKKAATAKPSRPVGTRAHRASTSARKTTKTGAGDSVQ